MRDFYHDVHTGRAYASVQVGQVAWIIGEVDQFRKLETITAIGDRLVQLNPPAHLVKFKDGKLPGLTVTRKAVTLRLGDSAVTQTHLNAEACATYMAQRYVSYHNLPDDGITRTVVQHIIRCAIRNVVLCNKRLPDILE